MVKVNGQTIFRVHGSRMSGQGSVVKGHDHGLLSEVRVTIRGQWSRITGQRSRVRVTGHGSNLTGQVRGQGS